MAKTNIVIGPVLVIGLILLVILIGAGNPGSLYGLIVNGIIGVLILVVLNKIFKELEVPINIWTILIAAIGGILGVILLILLNLMGMKDW